MLVNRQLNFHWCKIVQGLWCGGTFNLLIIKVWAVGTIGNLMKIFNCVLWRVNLNNN
jgi:hypothetical protein